jgi:hypothetical protein
MIDAARAVLFDLAAVAAVFLFMCAVGLLTLAAFEVFDRLRRLWRGLRNHREAGEGMARQRQPETAAGGRRLI